MLGLLTPTPKTWVEIAESDLEGLLSDHAHCELKAAHSALALVGRYGGEAPSIIQPLVALAHEETEHFDQVHGRLMQQDGTLAEPSKDQYVVALRRACREDHGDHPLFLDRLLISALIEARSCERFRLLAAHLRSADLRAFYRELMESEARHYRLFGRLAEEHFGFETSRSRFAILSQREASIAEQLPLGPTVHG